MSNTELPQRGDPYVDLLLERCTHIPNGELVCPDGNWDNPETIQNLDIIIRTIADAFGLDIYPNQYKICSTEGMLDAYAHIGMPVMYRHWSFGQEYLKNKAAYKAGQMGLAYEIVINSDPCISVNMEGNTAAMNFLVMAHAGQGHNSFFKGNKMFTEWTDAKGILPYLRFARDYVEKCYTQIGEAPVRQFLSSCHALKNMGVDRYKKPTNLKSDVERLSELEEAIKAMENPELDTTGEGRRKAQTILERNKKRLGGRIDYTNGQENLLYILEKESIAAQKSELVGGSPWMVELMRINRKIAQYFYPQKQTQVMNEGWASFWHHAICTVAYYKGYISQSDYIEMMHSHTSVIMQPDYNSPYYSGINPYALGFWMYRDIMFAARGPKTVEERKIYDEYKYEEVFKNRTYTKDGKEHSLIGGDWLDAMHHAMREHRDETFVSQFLSPKLCADFKFFAINDNDENSYVEVTGVQSDFEHIREKLAAQYELANLEPNINAVGFDPFGDRTLKLLHKSPKSIPLGHDDAEEVMKHVNVLLRGPKALDSSREYKSFKAHLTSIDTSESYEGYIMAEYGSE